VQRVDRGVSATEADACWTQPRWPAPSRRAPDYVRDRDSGT
jgi:hypothetical protein